MKPSTNLEQKSTLSNTATCPACGLLCDDIVLASATSIKNACPKGITFFEQAAINRQPSLAGKPCDLNAAMSAATEILRNSNQTLFAGLGTEVQGMRSLIRLAEKTGATLDHLHSEGTVRNTLAMQNGGWLTTTLTEVKNRADVILVIGTDIVSSHPRFFEKLVWNQDSLFNKPSPEIIYLGVAAENTLAGVSPTGQPPLLVPAETEKLPEVINALNALLNHKPLHADSVGGVAVTSLNMILDKLKAAQYAVVVWSASQLKNSISHAELTIQGIIQMVNKLNETSRAACLPLNSGDGDTSANYTSAWLSGYPTRNRFSNNKTQYDTYHYSSKYLLNSCDALLWVSTFNAYAPPKTNAPTIVIGHPNTQFTRVPDVFIPVAIPGLDHAGTMFRLDGTVVLPLKKVRTTTLATLSEVVNQIEANFLKTDLA